MYGINGGVFLYLIKKKKKTACEVPAYYLKKGLKKRWMGGLFAVSCLTLYSQIQLFLPEPIR
ncbi:hypothetical protein ASG99_09975 [Bacillus sp. Soil768D1]|nr:hypothetical protein ASG99_09975 [Bacillus sp. Soil768D1]